MLFLQPTNPLTYILDSNNTLDLSVEIVTKPVGSGEFLVELDFRSKKNGKLLHTVKKELGEAFSMPTISVGRFTTPDREQIFITISHQSAASYLFDFDGTKLRAPYKLDTGRATGFPSFDSHGHGQVAEFWPKRLYLEHFGSLKGVTVRNNMAIRIVKLKDQP